MTGEEALLALRLGACFAVSTSSPSFREAVETGEATRGELAMVRSLVQRDKVGIDGIPYSASDSGRCSVST